MPGTSGGFTLAEAAELAGVIVALGVIAGIYKGTMARLRATVFSRRDLAGRLDRLACGVTSDYVAGLLGPPVFSRHVSEIHGDPVELSDRIYRTRHAWVQVIVSSGDDAVQCFSITVTDPYFRFRTRGLTFGCLDIRLGYARFSGVTHLPDGWRLPFGLRSFGYPSRFGYAESHYFGFSGMYQAYLLGYNDASLVGDFITASIEPCAAGRLSAEAGYEPFADLEPLPDWLQRARDSFSVNTLTVLGASTRASLADIAGVDADRIGVLRTQSQRKVRRLGRKRWKHYERQARREFRRKAKSGGDADNPAASPLSPEAEP